MEETEIEQSEAAPTKPRRKKSEPKPKTFTPEDFAHIKPIPWNALQDEQTEAIIEILNVLKGGE